MPKRPYRRRNVLPIPALQFQLVAICLFFAACSGMMQSILVQRFVTELFLAVPETSAVTRSEASMWVMRQFFVSLAIMFPFVLGLGIIVTFRFAGPIVNMKNHLKKIAAGQDPGPCRLRKGDQLQDLAEAINDATAALRARAGAPNAGAVAANAVAPPSVAVSEDDETVEQTAS